MPISKIWVYRMNCDVIYNHRECDSSEEVMETTVLDTERNLVSNGWRIGKKHGEKVYVCPQCAKVEHRLEGNNIVLRKLKSDVLYTEGDKNGK